MYVQFWRCSFCNNIFESPTEEMIAAEIRFMSTGAVMQACKSCVSLMPNAAQYLDLPS